jgi:2-polyprenyl-6-methoxyphenol hydroxylase-like FAD-dependent oxidoreductase
MNEASTLDVLVVGAGPTGLALASQLARWGVRFRIIDKRPDRAQESRALGVQPRSLELLQSIGLGERLAERGRTATRLVLHLDRSKPATIDLGDIDRADTRFPYILFVSQANTEAVLADHLESCGVTIERRVELAAFEQNSGGLICTLRHAGERDESIRIRYLAGCDGAHSTVRRGANIPFEGGAYLQNFALGDVEADGPLVPDGLNVFALGRGLAVFFPLGHPATWRVIAIQGREPQTTLAGGADEFSMPELSLPELQAMVGDPTRGTVRLRDPVWLTRFRLHHRQAARYREGNVFLAGDAAHIHSPVGAQGMNTGIQDSWNLGWKLAMVSRGLANEEMLESYNAERWPVGRTLLRATDRIFAGVEKSVTRGSYAAAVRRLIVRHAIAPALSRRRIRSIVFHFVSQLGIRYANSPVVTEGTPSLRRGPRAGDRLPDTRVRRGGQTQTTYLQEELLKPCMMLLLCGPVEAWNSERLREIAREFHGVLRFVYLASAGPPKLYAQAEGPPYAYETSSRDATLVDEDGTALSMLGVDNTAQYLIRPDGHVAFRCAGADLSGVEDYLRRWFPPLSSSLPRSSTFYWGSDGGHLYDPDRDH